MSASASMTAIYEHRVGHRLMASGGIRTDAVKTRNRGGYFGKRSTDDIAVSGHIALMADLPLDLDASLKASIGYREPSLSDRYFRGISGRGFVTGSPELDPERSFQVDFALRRTGRRHSIAFFAYDYRIHDLVERFRNGNDFFFRNRGEAEIRGVELEGEARFPLGITLQAGAALARGEAVHDEPLDDIAAPTLHVTFRKGGARSSVFLSALAFGRDDRPGPVETERPGYVTVDLGGGWHFTKALELRLLLRNATDRFYAGSSDASASAAPGRSVAIGVNGKL